MQKTIDMIKVLEVRERIISNKLFRRLNSDLKALLIFPLCDIGESGIEILLLIDRIFVYMGIYNNVTDMYIDKINSCNSASNKLINCLYQIIIEFRDKR